MKKYDVIVIGAGAAGLIAAARAAELGANVLLVEKMKQAGRKLLITGKGRCNITNTASQSEFIKKVHPNGRFLKHAFSTFFTKEIVALLNKLGVETMEERGGRIFPTSEKAFDVVNAFLNYAKNNKVEIWYNCKVDKILEENKRIKGIQVTKDGKINFLETENVILCTGGKSYPATGSTGDGYKLAKELGHSIDNTRPALVPLETEGNLAEQLQGLALKNAKAVVWVNGKKKAEDFGELLFTHFGLSGPIIITLSRIAVDELNNNNQVEISIDLKPALDENKLDNRILRDLNEHGKKRIENIVKLWLPGKLVSVFIQLSGVDPNKEGHQINSKERKKMRILLKDLRFKITGHRSFKEAIITAGGINTNEIEQKTMQSKIVSNLYFAGEVIDLDGDTGGYNLQIAYSTAWLAAESCVN